ncbi:hypothetical protein SODALDRAFT_355190 [Sodiomyces alkalinus F11]|uniref:R3H-associated N-terminal domain-containing protein n=1 Tax=Sodiomyces alkalinus (strain CBS 110278 / VKM F-3762 / F11) TaxID=1314773 RepID=A0A3N2Q891_SODAK|nr:hypothetical protein SODALDRAFT_355190 [Sodiomyces alkalinus F11]ROT43001.1 hypothetical protein SODALDRAFT_355190 [Sodiomyces alkalinus F11]
MSMLNDHESAKKRVYCVESVRGHRLHHLPMPQAATQKLMPRTHCNSGLGGSPTCPPPQRPTPPFIPANRTTFNSIPRFSFSDHKPAYRDQHRRIMAIYSAVPPPPNLDPADGLTDVASPPSPPPQPSVVVLPQTPSYLQSSSRLADIEAWTLSALQSLRVSPIARGTGSPLTIPLDEAARLQHAQTTIPHRSVTIAIDAPPKDPIRRPPSCRDSQKTREALLKGHEGSRQRRRWENDGQTTPQPVFTNVHAVSTDRLIHVPNVQPPLPSDFAPHPTHPVQKVPYHLAAYWDREPKSGAAAPLRQRFDEKHQAQQARRKKQQLANGSATGLGAGMVPRDLRDYAKRSPAVRNWLQHLEEPVRGFAQRQRAAEALAADEETDIDGLDSEDEEIVFVGRKNQAAATATRAARGWKRATREVGGSGGAVESGVVFDDLGDDETAPFKRWLIHSLSTYYGLQSRSVTAGSPPRRVVYVGIKSTIPKRGRANPFRNDMPRPLWETMERHTPVPLPAYSGDERQQFVWHLAAASSHGILEYRLLWPMT